MTGFSFRRFARAPGSSRISILLIRMGVKYVPLINSASTALSWKLSRLQGCLTLTESHTYLDQPKKERHGEVSHFLGGLDKEQVDVSVQRRALSKFQQEIRRETLGRHTETHRVATPQNLQAGFQNTRGLLLYIHTGTSRVTSWAAWWCSTVMWELLVSFLSCFFTR